MKQQFRNHLRTKITVRNLVLAGGLSALLIAVISLVYLNFGVQKTASAAVIGDYRTINSGNWTTVSIWETYNGVSWIAALTAPTSTNGTITIQNTHTVTITSSMTLDQVEVATGGTLTITSGTLTLANGTGSDLNITGTATLNGSGKLTISAGALVTILSGGVYNYDGGTETLTGGWYVQNGGTYVHNVNGINIPKATWESQSTIKVTGVTNSDLNGLTQDFGNFTYDSPAQTAVVEFRDQLGSIKGDFTIINTGSSSIFLQRTSTATPVPVSGNLLQTGGLVYMTKGAAYTFDIGGNFTITGGTFIEVERYGMPVLNIHGNFYLNGGTFNHSTYNSNLPNEGIGVVNLYGDYIGSGALHTETATLTGRGDFFFTKSGTQKFIINSGSITNTVNFIVNSGAVLDMAQYIITGDGSFTLSADAGIILGDQNGITAAAASGNVQVTGSRNFSTSGDYTYAGSSSQVTGNGLPSQIRNLTINNGNNVTLTGSSSASGIISLLNGKVITGSSELGSGNTSTTSIVNHSTNRYIVGNLRRAVSATGNYEFPVGTMAYYEPATLSFTAMTGINSVLGTFTNANPIEAGHPLSGLFINGTDIIDMIDYGYWEMTPDIAMTGGEYAITVKEQGYTNSSGNPEEYGIVKRAGLGSDWQSLGKHVNSTQTEIGGVITAVRSELTSFSHFAIGKGYGPLPVTLVSFTAVPVVDKVKCEWKTMTELNNDYFTVERATNQNDFVEIAKVTGSGTTSQPHNYSCFDDHPKAGTSYYRLKQTDYNGASTYSQIVKVSTSGKNNSGGVTVHPNPFADAFTAVFYSDNTENGILTVISSNGNVIYKQSILINAGNNSALVTIPSDTPHGTYLLNIQSNSKSLKSTKIIKK